MNGIKKIKFLDIFSYILIFFTFMGSNFLKFNLFGVSFNVARVLILVATLIGTIDIFHYLFKNKTLKNYIKNKNIKFCLVFFVIWSIYSVASIYKNLDLTMYLINNFFICCGTVCMIFFCRKINVKKNYNKIFNTITLSLISNCLYYLYLYFITNNNIGGWYHNTNDLATVLLIGIPIVIYLFFTTKKFLYLIISIIYMACLKYTLSRASMLGIALAIVFFILIYLFKNRKKILNVKLKKFLFILLSLGIVIGGSYIFIKSISKFNFKPVESCNSNQVRLNLIYNALYFLKNDMNWLFGIGAGNTLYYLEHFSIYPICNFFNLHNFWLDIIVGYGSIIFMGFIYTYFKMIKELIKNISSRMSIVFLFFLFSFLIACISSSSVLTREWLWILFAIILSYINFLESKN